MEYKSNKIDVDKLLNQKSTLMVAIPIIIIAALIWSAFFSVGPGQRGVMVKLGAVQEGVIAPGAHFKIPFVDNVVKLNVRVQKFAAKESAASKDLQNVSTTVAINFHLDPSHVDDLFKTVGRSNAVERKVLTPAASNAVKAVTARYNAEDLISHRDKVRQGIEAEIRKALTPYNVTIDAVNITDFAFSREYANAIEKKQVAQQRALQAQYELQKTKIDSQQKVVKAQAQATATVVAAKAQAKALNLKRKAVTPELIMLDAVQRWDGKMPTVYAGGGKGILPMLDLKRFLPHGGADGMKTAVR